ncbi:MAG: SGNH/GDSL hydrolase family protein [Chloroflexi bacterium]|nr:SGNH/GDSL hydrolase family protein [Chloroflexota bacterium]
MEILQVRSDLTYTRRAIESGQITIGFMGGSITDSRPGWNWPEPVLRWFKATYPQVRVTVENGAIGATGSDLAVFRAKETLIDTGCDLIFVEYAVNDSGFEPERRRRTQEGLLRKLLAPPGRDVVLVYTYIQDFYNDMIAGRMPVSIAALETLAEHYRLNSVWMSLYALQRVQQGFLRWEEWLPDGLHPQAHGSLAYGEAVIQLLEPMLAGKVQAPERGALPEPLNAAHWSNSVILPLSEVRTEGPWLLRRWYNESNPFMPYVLDTAAVGARFSLDFEGRGLVLGFDYGSQSGELRYRLDDGEWRETKRERFAWAGPTGWYKLEIVADDLHYGKHHFEAEVIHGNLPECKGTDMRLGLVGVVR